MLPTIGQYSIDITINYSFKCYDAPEARIAYSLAHVFSCTIFQTWILYTFCKQITLYCIEKLFLFKKNVFNVFKMLMKKKIDPPL